MGNCLKISSTDNDSLITPNEDENNELHHNILGEQLNSSIEFGLLVVSMQYIFIPLFSCVIRVVE